MAAPRTLPNLRALLDRSGLLPAALLDPAFADAPDPDAALDRLLADRLLTPFQAAQLRKGRPDHFFLTDKYKVLDYVGAGGMGKVYLCEHLILHRLVAVKLLQRAADGPDAARSFERFYREARAVAALSDPNIVRVYDVDRAGGLPFMVMEYVDGSNLHDVVTRHGPLAAGRAANYVGQAALGLQHAHEVGLVHRDVKPGNLMLDRAGTVKLLDLGLARFHADPDRNAGITDRYDKHMVIGTVDFMAPEQAFDTAKVDIRSDIYGLGCTLYFLLTGRVPFPDRTPPEKMYAHKTLAPAPVSEICPRLPPELLDVLDRMTAKDPADRFQTPAEVEAALAAWKDVPPPPAREMPEHPAGFYRLGISPAPELKSPQVSTPDPLSTLETDRTPRPDNWSPPGPSTPRPRARPPATGAEDPSIVLTFPPASGTPGPRLRAARRHKRLVRLTELALFVMCAGAVGWLASREWMHAARPTNPDPAPPPPAAAPREAVAPFAGPVVNAGGVTFADPVMQRWAAVYEKQHGVRVDYQPVGLEKGVQAALDRVYLFGGTVVPLTPGQLAAARAKDGEVLHVPLALGAVAVAYNLPDVADPVRFTGPVLADIYLGKIARWSDPALTVSNPGLRLPDLPIVVVRHAGPTGTTALWTEFLSRTSADWRAKVGTGTDVPWPVGTGAKSNAGTATTVSRTAGAVGYLELSYAVANNLPVGRVQNKDGRFVPPTPGGLSAAAAGLPRPLPADLRYSLTDRPGEDAYPIGGTVWAVLYADQTKRPAGKELVSFLRWALADGQGYLAEAQFAPLPPDVVKLAEDQLSTVRVAER